MGVRPRELVGHQLCSITLWWLVRVRPAPPRSRALLEILLLWKCPRLVGLFDWFRSLGKRHWIDAGHFCAFVSGRGNGEPRSGHAPPRSNRSKPRINILTTPGLSG